MEPNKNAPEAKKRGFRGTRNPKFTELGGFKIGDYVRLKIVAVPEDHIGRVISINARKEFKVLVKSTKTPSGGGVWGPIWLDELEHYL